MGGAVSRSIGSPGAAAPPQYAAWPALIGAEMMVNGNCSSSTGWGLPAGAVIALGKLSLTTLSDTIENDGITDTLIIGASYRFLFTIDTVSLGSVRWISGATDGTSRSTVGTFSEDLIVADVAAQMACTSATMQLDNFSVKSVGLLGISTDWSFTGSTPPTFTAGGAIDMNGCDTGDVASLTGSAKTAFDAAVSNSATCNVNITIAGYVQSNIEIRMKGGSWVEVSIAGDGVASAEIASGTGSGFDIRGKSTLSGPAILQITFIQISLV